MEAMFISHAIFLLHKQYLLFKVHCQSFAGMINQNSEKSSFTASKESLQWVREYLSETLFYSRKCAKEQEKSGVLWGGWFQERDWKHWQAHMEKLIGRMDELLTREGETVALWTGSICQKAEPGKIAGKKEGEERENLKKSL